MIFLVYPFIPKKSFSNTSSSRFCESESFFIDLMLTVSESNELDFLVGLTGFDSASLFFVIFFGDSVAELSPRFLGEVDLFVFLRETVF